MDMHIKMTEVKCLRGEAGDSVLKWSCKKEDEFNICGRCQSCVLSEKLHHYSQWMNKAGGASQRRFLTGILVRCHNLQILEDLQNVLQVTSGKDFTYSRSRALPSKPEDSMDGALDTKLHGMDMLETWEWFRKSPDWTKSKYVLGLLSLCDTPLLHMLANLVRVLIVWEKHSNTDLSVTGSRFSYHSDDPEECILYEPAGLPQEAQQGSQTDVLKQEYSEQIKDAKSLKSICHKVELDMQNLDPWNKRKGRDSDSDSSDDPDPALTVVPRSSKSLSGVSRHKDFIRRLPVDIAKIILGLLDKVSLYSCRSVSKHWQCLTDQILTEMEVKKSVEKHAMILQGNSTSKVNPVYAKICEVLVPVSEDHKHSQHRESFPKHKLAQEQVLDSVYKDFNSKTVQMEERNVYCGVYNILVLLEREDPSRVMHYAGGEFVAVGSRDRTIKLLHVASSKDPLVIQGHAGSVRAVLICEERDLVISASYDLSIRCWNLKTGVCTMIFHGHFGTINCLDLYGNRLVSGAKDCRVRVWNLLTGKCVENLKFKHLKPIMCVKINETLVVSGCAGGQIRIWSMETASLIRQISGHQGAVLCLCFDQWHILSGGSDGEVKVWSTNSCFEKCLRTFQHPKEVLTMSFLFLRIITGCMDGKIRIFNFLNGDCLRVIKTNMKQCPVLSLHTYHNTVVVNTKSSILMLQFAEVHWDYSASPFFKRSQISLENVPHSASQITRGGSPSPKSGFHRIKNLSTPSLQHARDAQKESTREVIWSQLKAHRHSRASINLQSECLTLPRSVLSAGRSVSGYKNFQNRVSHIPSTTATTTINLDKKNYGTKLSVLSQSEKAARDRVRKRGPHHPMTPDLILLRAGSCQQSWHSDLARSNMELNARVRDAWGPDSSKEPSFQTITKRTSEIHAPFATPSVDLNPQRSLQSRQTCFTSHSPPIQSQRSFKVIRSGTNKFGPLNTTSPEDGKAPQRLFMRRSSMPTHCHEDFEMTNMSGLYHVLLDPFRDNGAFQLRTDTQLEAFIQEGTRQQQSHKHGRGDQSKSVWKRSHCHQ